MTDPDCFDPSEDDLVPLGILDADQNELMGHVDIDDESQFIPEDDLSELSEALLEKDDQETDGSEQMLRWPDDDELVAKWAVAFMIRTEISPFVCARHFADEDFCINEYGQLSWSQNAMPRHGLPGKNSNNKFRLVSKPGPSNAQNVGEYARKMRRPHTYSKDHLVRQPLILFRRSQCTISSNRKTHDVAVIPLPNDVCRYYEFSYNGRMGVDGSKYYACLGCRRANAEEKDKTDRVRTILLDGFKYRSRYDAFGGHHRQCVPCVDPYKLYLQICYGPDDMEERIGEQM